MKQVAFAGLFILFACCAGAQTADTAQVYTLADTVVAKRLLEEGTKLNNEKKLEEAFVKLTEAGEIYKQVLGEETLEHANVLHQMGRNRYFLNKYDDAINFYGHTLTIRLKKLDSESLEVASTYNGLGIAYDENGNYDKALDAYYKSLNICLILGKENLIATCYNNIGAVLYNKGYYDEACENVKKALSIRIKVLGEFHLMTASSYNNLGVYYNVMGDNNKAIDYYIKALEIRKKNLPPDHPDLSTSYRNIGNSYRDKGDYEKGILYLNKAMKAQKKTIKINNINLSDTYKSLGSIYYMSKNYEKSKYYLKQSILIKLNVLGENDSGISDCYNNLGLIYEISTLDSALFFYNRSLNIHLEVLGENHPDVAVSYNNLGNVYLKKGDFINAIEYHKKALSIRLNKFGSFHSDMVSSFYNLSLVYHKAKNDSCALAYFNQAIFASNYLKKNVFFNVQDIGKLIEVLAFGKQFYLDQYHLTHSRPPLDTALSYAQQAVAALEYQQKSITSEGSKAQLADNHYAVYEGAIETSLLVADLDRSDSLRHAAFDYAERSKAALLRAKMKESEALGFAGIPDSLLQQEYDLRIDISWRERQRQEKINAGQSETDSTILALSGKIFDLRQRYDTLKTRFEHEYPEYYRAKYDLRTLSLREVQQTLLEPEQTLLEYFAGDSAVYAFVVNRDDYRVLKIKKDFNLDSLVRVMRESIVSPHERPLTDSLRNAAPVVYAQSATLLYEKLVAPAKRYLKSRVVIVPDGPLGYLPFEALLTKQPEKAYRYHTHPYLLHEHQISYCYSATLLRDMCNLRQRKDKQQVPKGTWLGMAPYFTGDTTLLADLFAYTDNMRKDLRPLPFAGKEVANIAKLMNGKPLYGKEASKKAFEQLASQYRVLHLSTHGQANDRTGDYSFLAFGESKDSTGTDLLYVHDLYNYSLNADLVTLSACETGIGQLLRGEGIVSLARAFSYAGAKSIATSLWQVSDAKTQTLMIDFYKGLVKDQGANKDSALSEAKRKMTKSRDKSDPYYWAGFILIGDSGRL